MTYRSRGPEAGVTLVEMLVALALFALVGLASFATLDAVVRTRERTEGRLEAVAALDRALILFGRDLAQSDPLSQRIAEGVLSFGLVATGGPAEMSYVLTGGALARRAGDDGLDQRLVDGVADLGWRALDRAGTWHDAWPPEAEAAPLAGVEMRLTLAALGQGAPSTVLRLVEVPHGLSR